MRVLISLGYKNCLLAGFISLLAFTCNAATNKILKTYPAPKGAVLSSAFKVSVDTKPLSVYLAKVAAGNAVRRFKAVDDLLHSEQYFDEAAFTYFDLQGTATITVTVNQNVRSAKILPSSAGIRPVLGRHTVSFKVSKPQNLTIEINGEVVKSLHVFVNPIETRVPSSKDPNIIYFGPGIHKVSHMVIGDNKTVYIAPGAVIQAVVDPKAPFGIEPSGLKNYAPVFELRGNHIKFYGHGIIDGSALPTHAGNFIYVHGTDVQMNGVILVNSAGWTVPLRQCTNVNISNIKILGYRANTDGIDICNSHNVTVDKCFVRTNDDLIVIKTELGEGPSDHIVVKNCVLWNQLANALSLGAELRHDVSDVLFSNCDIIHDYSRAWCLRVFHTDASTISNITFNHIRLEEAHLFINLWIGKTQYESHDRAAGHIRQVTFSNITATGNPLNIDIVGAGDQNKVEGVYFKNIKVNGKPLDRDMIKTNPFVSNIQLQP
ncbi:hypothetical protein GCM10027037_27330 [Mucilaginibacter koreensis]